jgi:two-component sensor histidine kinase
VDEVGRETTILAIEPSADGPADLQRVLRALPRHAGLAFVVTLDDGLSADALVQATELQIELARDGIAVEPDRVYLCPPGQRVAVENGLLRLVHGQSLEQELRETRARLRTLESEAETQRRTLIEELNHRVRNMLTVIGAIAKQTLVRTESPVRFTEAFLGRLQAMANSYNLIAKQHWGPIALADIVMSELTSVSAARFEVNGPVVTFKPSQAVALELVVHELVTNAVRHGPLAAPAGRLAVSWSIDDGRVVLVWRETGGSGIATPERHGFGLQLVERQIASALDGATSFDWSPDGLTATLSMPVPQP